MKKEILLCLMLLFAIPALSADYSELTQEELLEKVQDKVEYASNHSGRILNPDVFEDYFYSLCSEINEIIPLIEDPVMQAQAVESLINFPTDNNGIKSSVIVALSSTMDYNSDAYDYIFNSLTDESVNTKYKAAQMFLKNGQYDTVKNIIFNEEWYSLFLSYDVPECVNDIQSLIPSASLEGKVNLAFAMGKYGDESQQEEIFEYVLNKAELNSDEAGSRAKYYALRYLTKKDRHDLISKTAQYADDSNLLVSLTSVDMLKVYHIKGFDEATTSLRSISENH